MISNRIFEQFLKHLPRLADGGLQLFYNRMEDRG